MSLNGSRQGPFAAFTCTWTDAIGRQQATYSSATGWRGSVIQLECGADETIHFHLRLFAMGGWTAANAHLDVIIPGTADHQVLSWELAEQLVAYDLGRSGLIAAAPAQTGSINAAPTFREIPAVIYNGLPVELRFLTGGPLFGTVSSGVGMATNGSATVLSLSAAPPAPGSSQSLALTYGQVIPKPVCNSGGELIRVDGPVTLRQEVRVSGDGTLNSQTFIDGDLIVRAFDSGTGGLGDAMEARVRDHFTTHVNSQSNSVLSTRHQQLSTGSSPERSFRQLRVGSGGPASYRSDEMCN